MNINGKDIEIKDGDTILDTAARAGIYVPTLCAYEDLPGFGACRMCLVDVKDRGFMTACTTPAEEGMIVETETEELMELKRSILELILSEHPSACIVCEDRELCFKYNREPTKAGRMTGCRFCPHRDECELYEMVQYLDIKDIRVEMEYKNIPVKRDDYFIDRDYNFCILCGRCVRVCSEVRGIEAIAFTNRGHVSTIGTSFEKSLIESDCIFCGACVDVCPTGAISEKMSKWGGKADKVTTTTCILCPVGCSINVESKWDKVTNVGPSEKNSNGGQLCVKGRFIIPPLVNHPGRIKYPMIREDGVLKPVSWEEAIAFAAEKLKAYKGNEIAFVVSPWLTNEAAYVMGKFARSVMGTNNMLVASNMLSGVMVPLTKALGYCGPKGTIDEIDKAETILIVGTDLNLSAPVLLVPIYKAKKRGAKIILIDREAKKIPRYMDDYISPQSYAAFFSEVFKRLNQEGQRIDVPGGESASTRELSEMVRDKRTAIILGQGLTGEDGARTVALLCNMIASLGNGIIIPVWDGGNLQGVLDMGAISGLLPGQFCISDADAKEFIEHLWGTSVPEGREDWKDVKALYLTQPISEIPEGVEFLILQSVFNTELTKKADVVFPDKTFTGCSGTVTNLERRMQSIAQCTKPDSMAIDSWEIIARIAKKMDSEGFDYRTVDDITDEIFKCIPGMTMGLHTRGDSINPVDLDEENTLVHEVVFPDGKITYQGANIGDMVKDFGNILSEWGYNHE